MYNVRTNVHTLKIMNDRGQNFFFLSLFFPIYTIYLYKISEANFFKIFQTIRSSLLQKA